MKVTTAVESMRTAFIDSLRVVHSSRHRGVFVLSNDSTQYHSLLWSEYPVSSTRGPFIPRLHIDRFSDRLPRAIASIWRVEQDALFVPVGLEITVIESEIPSLSVALPAIISHIEQGKDSGFDALLPFPTNCTTATNIWSQNANVHANASRAGSDAL